MESYMIFKMFESIRQEEADAINNIPYSDAYGKAIEQIMRVHYFKGKLITSGVGKAGQIALNIATTFSSTGTPAVFLHPVDAQHGDLGVIQPNDVLLLISNSGETREIVKLASLAYKLHNTILSTIVITGTPESSLDKLATVSIHTGNPKEVCPLGLAPTTSTTVMTVIGDILISMMTDRIGLTPEQYALRHHSGYLGDKARNAID
jgi:arabinose-5-phosphate isomerase